MEFDNLVTQKRDFYQGEQHFNDYIHLLSPKQKQRIRYIEGHDAYYGIHEPFNPAARYFTFIRDPIARTLSLYNFERMNWTILNREIKHDYHMTMAVERLQKHFLIDGKVPDFETWLHKIYKNNYRFYQSMSDNLQYLRYIDDNRDEKSFTEALKKFYFVGLSETFETDARYLFSLLKSKGFIGFENKADSFVTLSSLSPSIINQVKDANTDDLILYECARKANEKCKVQHKDFYVKIKQFKRVEARTHFKRFLRPKSRLRSLCVRAVKSTFQAKWFIQCISLIKSSSSIRIIYISGQPDTNGAIYRVDRYVEAAKTAGFIAQGIRISDIKRSLMAISCADIIVIWRAEWNQDIQMVTNIVKHSGAKIVFDSDDLVFDPNLANIKTINGICAIFRSESDAYKRFESLMKTYQSAHFYSAATEFLAKKMTHNSDNYFVLPNGFDSQSLRCGQDALKHFKTPQHDGFLRIGYAAGTPTHQRDFAQIAPVISQILQENPNCRLVLFKLNARELLDISEFPILNKVYSQIEWRDRVKLSDLPNELARFDINLAPLEIDNVFCNAKSELKYFEAALVHVPTIASPTEPYRLTIKHNVTGFLAETPKQWYETLNHLIQDDEHRKKIGRAAYEDVIWKYGPERRVELIKSMVNNIIKMETIR
jgi:glycosyltransferase involved in cell wall biosynthesis